MFLGREAGGKVKALAKWGLKMKDLTLPQMSFNSLNRFVPKEKWDIYFSFWKKNRELSYFFSLLNYLPKDPIDHKSFPEILLTLWDCRIAASCSIFETRVIMKDKRNGIEINAKECEKWKLRAFLTDGVRNGKMYFRLSRKANLVVPGEYLLVRGCLQEVEIHSNYLNLMRLYSK